MANILLFAPLDALKPAVDGRQLDTFPVQQVFHRQNLYAGAGLILRIQVVIPCPGRFRHDFLVCRFERDEQAHGSAIPVQDIL